MGVIANTPQGHELVRLAHVSDVHVGAASQGSIDALVADVVAARPDATIVTGDLTMRARRREFAGARELLHRLPSPHLVVLGNHDVPLYDVSDRLTDPYEDYQEGVHHDLDPVLDLPGARVLGLQTQPRWRWKSGRVSRRQAAMVTDLLGETPPGRLRVLAMHHPPSLRGLQTLMGIGRLREALGAAAVDVVLAGHTHVPRVSLLPVKAGEGTREVLEIVAGTAASDRTRDAARSWTLVTADAATIQVRPRVRSDGEWTDGPLTDWPRGGPDGPAAG